MKPTLNDDSIQIYRGDCLAVLPSLTAQSVNCCVTSPPYFGLRSYIPENHPNKKLEIGNEKTPEEYIDKLVAVFRDVKRVLRDDGTLWVNIGDSYARNGGAVTRPGSTAKAGNTRANVDTREKSNASDIGCKQKDIIGIPWMLAFALRADGWYLRQDIIWHKPNPMPESVTDRCTKSHEYIFLLSKSPKYYFDNEAIKEDAQPDNCVRNRDDTKLNNCPGRSKMGGLKTNGYEKRNKRDVWTVAAEPSTEKHFAMMPTSLVQPCILAGCPIGGTVIDPFCGTGTTARVAESLGRKAIIIELNEESVSIAKRRNSQQYLGV